MDNSKGAVERAKITYFFKETFRAHSKAEYREIFSRGLNEDNGGVTGAFPWLYVRAFFALLMLFTVNTLVLRLTNNALYVPSVTFLGGITFTVPFIILMLELYPKRDISLFMLISVLVIGGTLAGVLAQIGYKFVNIKNEWVSAIYTGVLEEVCKAIPALITISLVKQKNPYACFLFAATVGAGFSVIEDMGYIFYYSDKYVFYYHSDIQATVAMFVDRGLSSFCTHILWTGAIGWAYGIAKRPLRSFGIAIFVLSVALHICWDLPIDGWVQVLDISLCVVVAAALNITIVHLSRTRTLYAEVDHTHLNEVIIREAKEMGVRMRFTNAANLTFALTCTFLSVIVLILCAMPIGMEYQSIDFDTREDFINYIEEGYNLKADRDRKYDPNGVNVEERYIEDEGKLVLAYVVQKDTVDGYDGEYYYGYFVKGYGLDSIAGSYVHGAEIDSIAVELEEIDSRIYCTEYKFGNESEWAFTVYPDKLIDYVYHANDGSVTAVTDAEEFEGYGLLTALCATAFAITAGCTVVLVAFIIKLRRVQDDEKR